MATQDDYIRTALRVPPTLHKQIHEAAASNNRTFNAEIVARLQKSFEQRIQPGGIPPANAPEWMGNLLNAQNESQKEELLQIFESIRPTMEILIRLLQKEKEKERKDLIEMTLGTTEPVSKTKKPKA